MDRETYLNLYRMPDAPPPLHDAKALATWIGHVRGVAFIGGRRGGEIDQAEAAEIIRHLGTPSPHPEDSRGGGAT